MSDPTDDNPSQAGAATEGMTPDSCKALIRPHWPRGTPWPARPVATPELAPNSARSASLRRTAAAGLTPEAFRTVHIIGAGAGWPGLFPDLMTQGWAPVSSILSPLLESNTPVQIGADVNGENVTMGFRDFLAYARTNTDRNPMMVFDAIVLDTSRMKGMYQVADIFNADDLFQYIDASHRPPFSWFLVGPTGSGSPVHTDPAGTSAWNALLKGQKRWVLFHPSTPRELLTTRTLDAGAAVVEGAQRTDLWDDLWGWFHEDLEGIKAAVERHFEEKEGDGKKHARPRCIDFLQSPNEIVFVPSGWHHAVLNVSETVAITHNFVDRTNVNAALEAMGIDEDAELLRATFREKLEAARPEMMDCAIWIWQEDPRWIPAPGAVVTPSAVTTPTAVTTTTTTTSSTVGSEEEDICGICLDPLPLDDLKFQRFLCCGKGIHSECGEKLMRSALQKRQKACIMCRQPLVVAMKTKTKRGNRIKQSKKDSKKQKIQLQGWVDKGKRWAQFLLGRMYDVGIYGCKRDLSKAIALYELAAQQDHPTALFNLAVCYRDGSPDTPQSFALAASYFERAATQGHLNAKHSLGCIYANGHGIPGGQNLRKARDLIVSAAECGYAPSIAALKQLDAHFVAAGLPSSTAAIASSALGCSFCGNEPSEYRIIQDCPCHRARYCAGRSCQRKQWKLHKAEHFRVMAALKNP